MTFQNIVPREYHENIIRIFFQIARISVNLFMPESVKSASTGSLQKLREDWPSRPLYYVDCMKCCAPLRIDEMQKISRNANERKTQRNSMDRGKKTFKKLE